MPPNVENPPTPTPGRNDTKLRLRPLRFQDLMRRRVHHILFVSSLYDSFTLVEDGRLNDAIEREFGELDLSQYPDITRVSTGTEALDLAASQRRFDLLITNIEVGDMNAARLAREIRRAGLDIPVVLLAFNNRELSDFMAREDTSDIERVFLWQGDVRLMMAIVKHVEDRWNLVHDTGELGVPAIIVVEDNVRFYSSFLPTIYFELMRHTRRLIDEGLNLAQRTLRVRARPKVLLCSSYEEAWDLFTHYEEQVLGVISDIEFPWRGETHKQAGVELVSRVREVRPDVPTVLQSSRPENERLAHAMGASFLLKGSPQLLNYLRRLLVENFGFGDFVFRLPDGSVVGRARDLKQLMQQLESVPAESLAFHGERNHFSNWLKARTEFALAHNLRPRRVSDFESLEHLRQTLIRTLRDYRRKRDRVIVADFDPRSFDPVVNLTRVGGGSLGGKARGLAFINRLLSESDVYDLYPDIDIVVPTAVVLGTDVFDAFLEGDGVRSVALESSSEDQVLERFLAAPFPTEALADLRAFLEVARYPLAVRSSGLLEDSPFHPFSGVYRTYMLPNNAPDIELRLAQLIEAVKRVYASTFSSDARSFLRLTPYRMEEEKMAVIIQRIAGSRHGDRFYPDFSGVARSYNFYPAGPMKPQEGIVAVALGLGRTVVDGEPCLRFSPAHPDRPVGFTSVDEMMENAQRQFYALDLSQEPGHYGVEGVELTAYELRDAEQDGVLALVGSTYDHDNRRVYDGVSRPGVRLVTFAPILKHDMFPLADLLRDLLTLGSYGTSSHVEIEFAVNLHSGPGGRPEFAYLQMRPLALCEGMENVELGEVEPEQVLCRSESVLGNGVIDSIRDLVVVDFHHFDRAHSREAAQQVGRLNAQLAREGLAYLLIGVGRWGSADPHLGIPVSWNQIAGARVIVEAGFRDFRVVPSQGTHFFQNLTSCNVGYFTVNPEVDEGVMDWEWLAKQPGSEPKSHVRHIRLDHPVLIKMCGKDGKGHILKRA